MQPPHRDPAVPPEPPWFSSRHNLLRLLHGYISKPSPVRGALNCSAVVRRPRAALATFLFCHRMACTPLKKKKTAKVYVETWIEEVAKSGMFMYAAASNLSISSVDTWTDLVVKSDLLSQRYYFKLCI